MGYRTVVMLSNDMSHGWSKDSGLGDKISQAMHGSNTLPLAAIGGAVVECVHADIATLAVLDGYTMFQSLSNDNWRPNEDDKEKQIRVLKKAAESLGYHLVKKGEMK